MLNVLDFITKKQASDALITAGLPAPDDDTALSRLFVRALCGTSKSTVTLALVNATNGTIDAPTLTQALRAAFPDLKGSDRDGKHYLSLCRTGKIKGVVTAPPKGTRVAQTAAKDAEIAALKAELEALKAKVPAAEPAAE